MRGAAPGTRETDVLQPGSLVERLHAVLLTGGSAFGLDAAAGVMRYLEEREVGFPTAHGVVPIVSAAVLYDLGVGQSGVRPDAAAGYAACLAATELGVADGRVGAGTGATVAKHKGAANARPGGIGYAAQRLPGGATVAALVAVNAIGSIVDPASGSVVVGPGSNAPYSAPVLGANTTIGVIATDLPFDKASANRLAAVAHDGLALAIRPAHTLYDGDALFVLSLGRPDLPPEPPLVVHGAVVQVVVEAILCAVAGSAGR